MKNTLEDRLIHEELRRMPTYSESPDHRKFVVRMDDYTTAIQRAQTRPDWPTDATIL